MNRLAAILSIILIGIILYLWTTIELSSSYTYNFQTEDECYEWAMGGYDSHATRMRFALCESIFSNGDSQGVQDNQ